MKVRLFGKTNDDKGTQLERLTKRLLEKLGYRNVQLNLVSSGGSELDIHAEYPSPGFATSQGIPLIGECKAYDAPIKMPDWLKFLGKVFTERACRNAHTRGLFMALSGANGNVAGAYEELKLREPSIELIMGDRLATLISEEFKLPTIQSVNTAIVQVTTDSPLEISVGYYDGRAFWIIEFSNSTFTLFLGRDLQEPAPDDLVLLVRSNIQAATYRNLFAEALARERCKVARKFVLGQLLTNQPLEPSLWDPMPIVMEPLTQADIESALDALESESLVSRAKGSARLVSLEENLSLRITVLKELLGGFFHINYFGTPQWNSLIDGSLLDESLKIKDNLSIPPEDRENLIRLITWSPNALWWALNPDPMLCGHQHEPAEVLELLRKDHSRYYKLQLLRLAATDFQTSPLNSVLLETHGLRELEFVRKAIFKSQNQVELEMEVSERTGIAHYDPTLGGGIAVVWLTENAPQPWGLAKQAANLPETIEDTSVTSQTHGDKQV